MHKRLCAAAFAAAVILASSPSYSATDFARCPSAPTIEDQELRADLEGKAEYLKKHATSETKAVDAVMDLIATYRESGNHVLAGKYIDHLACVLVLDPSNDLSPSQREALKIFVPAEDTPSRCVPTCRGYNPALALKPLLTQ